VSAKRIILIALIILVAAAAGAGVLAARGTSPQPSLLAQQRLRAAVVHYQVTVQPVRPKALWSAKTLTAGRCAELLSTYEKRFRTVVASGSQSAGLESTCLSEVLGQERDVARERDLPGTMVVGWTGRIAYWRYLRGDEHEAVVRAAVLLTQHSGRWDRALHRLADLGSTTYSSAAASEYTLRKVGGVWKVLSVRRWMWYDQDEGVHTDSA